MRGERWAWVAITRKRDLLRTYVNGSLCAEVKLKDTSGGADDKEEPSMPPKPSGSPADAMESLAAMRKKWQQEQKKAKEQAAARQKAQEGADAADGKEAEASPVGRFCIDPQHLALFGVTEAEDGDEPTERGLALRYVQLVPECWSQARLAVTPTCPANPAGLPTQRGRLCSRMGRCH